MSRYYRRYIRGPFCPKSSIPFSSGCSFYIYHRLSFSISRSLPTLSWSLLTLARFPLYCQERFSKGKCPILTFSNFALTTVGEKEWHWLCERYLSMAIYLFGLRPHRTYARRTTSSFEVRESIQCGIFRTAWRQPACMPLGRRCMAIVKQQAASP